MQNSRINLRVTEDELADVKGQAASAGLSLSAYARKRILGMTVTSKVDMTGSADRPPTRRQITAGGSRRAMARR